MNEDQPVVDEHDPETSDQPETAEAGDGADGADLDHEGAARGTSDDAGSDDDSNDDDSNVDDSNGDDSGESAGAEDSGDDDAGESDDDEDRVSAPSRTAALEREGEVAADFLETLLDICDLDGDIDVDVDGDRASVSVVDSEDGQVPRRLVGSNGVVLDALQELTRLAVQTATGERSRLMLDIAGHRADLRARLVEIAREAIKDVKDSGDRIELEPMSAFERKVVHDEVHEAGLVSESEGAEPHRFVVIHPA